MDPVLKMPSSQIFPVIFPFPSARKQTALIVLRRRTELIRILIPALARNKAAQIRRNAVANLGIRLDSYLLLIGVTVIKLGHLSDKVQVCLQNRTRKQVNKNVHECPHIPSTALQSSWLWPFVTARQYVYLSQWHITPIFGEQPYL